MNNDEIQLSDYIKLIGKHWIWAIFSFIIVFGAILAYTLTSSPVYESKSLVAITGQDQASFLFGNSAAPKVTDIETQKVVIQSSNVMYAVYSRHKYGSFSFNVNTVKGTNIIEIDVQSNNPTNSATIANDITATYVKHISEQRIEDAQKNLNVISGMLSQYDTEISSLNSKAAYYKNLGARINRTDQILYQNIQSEIIAKNQVYNALLEKREEAMLTTSLNSTNLKIIEYANVPQNPIKPNVQLNIILGIIIGLGAAIAMVIIVSSFSENEKKVIKKI